jgi:hypothetical protein
LQFIYDWKKKCGRIMLQHCHCYSLDNCFREVRLVFIWGYCNPTHFQIRGSLVQKWMLLLYVCEFICRLAKFLLMSYKIISINHRSPLMGWEFELKKKLKRKRKKIEENLFYIPHFNPIFLKLKGFPGCIRANHRI